MNQLTNVKGVQLCIKADTIKVVCKTPINSDEPFFKGTLDFQSLTIYEKGLILVKACRLDSTLVKRILQFVTPAIFDDEAIIIAAECGNTNIVRLLLKDGRVFPSARDNEAIALAAKNGHKSVVKLLLANNETLLTDYRPLRYAIENQRRKIIEIFLKDGRMNTNCELLETAVRIGNTKIVKLLLKYSQNINVLDHTLLDIAYQQRNINVMKLLLKDHRLDPEHDKKILYSACKHNEINIVDLFLRNERADIIKINVLIGFANEGVNKKTIDALLRYNQKHTESYPGLD